MDRVFVDFGNIVGAVKPMHAVNNGPVKKHGANQRIVNDVPYAEAGIPFARNHDASFCATYGGEHTVDVHAIFPDFRKDPYDPDSYDFAMTDHYLEVINSVGTEVFYRLGSKIEHGVKKYGTLPPPDFHKWAVICEHIIRHYTEGWADGFRYRITYWEIWNEPDLDPEGSPDKRTWGGTKAQFFELYHIAATHLKQCFPHLKIGGPALAGKLAWAEEFLAQLRAPLDFFSWHIYSATVEKIEAKALKIRQLLDQYGFTETESILNEWNYVRGWTGDDFIYSLRTIRDIKGAAFTAAVMCACQKGSVDMLMYYDARPCNFNGMFGEIICDLRKGYYPFKMFNALYTLGQEVCAEDTPHVRACAAVEQGKAAVLLSYFDDDDTAQPREVLLDFSGLPSDMNASWYILDKDHDMTLFKNGRVTKGKSSRCLTLPPSAVILIQMES